LLVISRVRGPRVEEQAAILKTADDGRLGRSQRACKRLGATGRFNGRAPGFDTLAGQ
jgi:hypothetical protein